MTLALNGLLLIIFPCVSIFVGIATYISQVGLNSHGFASSLKMCRRTQKNDTKKRCEKRFQLCSSLILTENSWKLLFKNLSVGQVDANLDLVFSHRAGETLLRNTHHQTLRAAEGQTNTILSKGCRQEPLDRLKINRPSRKDFSEIAPKMLS